MSSIPPNVVGPIAQSGMAQQNAARQIDNERNQQTDAIQNTAQRGDRVTEAVSEAENDFPVNTDAEGGTGSRGRDSTEEQAADEQVQSEDHGITRDEDGQFHVDLEA